MTEFNVRALVDLIEDLDRADLAGDRVEYVVVMRWNEGGDEGGRSDDEATAIVRALLREKLGTFPLAAVGAAVLTRIDERGPDA